MYHQSNESRAIDGIIGLIILQFKIIFWIAKWTSAFERLLCPFTGEPEKSKRPQLNTAAVLADSGFSGFRRNRVKRSSSRPVQRATELSSCVSSRTGFGICRKNAHTSAATKLSNASPNNPPAKLPVASFITPIHHGPKKPPRLPIELIHAIDAAAAVPVRNMGGIDQNGPFEP